MQSLGRFRDRVTTHVGFGQIEDQLSVADIGVRETELVAQKGAPALGLRGIEHRVYALDHVVTLQRGRSYVEGLSGGAP